MYRLAFAILPLLAVAGAASAAVPASNMEMSPAARAAASLPTRGPAVHRVTQALNLLEAQGYGDFKDFHVQGTDFAANVTRGGQNFPVTIDPDTETIARAS